MNYQNLTAAELQRLAQAGDMKAVVELGYRASNIPDSMIENPEDWEFIG